MKATFMTIGALLATLAVAQDSAQSWAFTFTGPKGGWTSVCTEATGAANASVPLSTPAPGPSTWTTSYDATYSSGSKTWAVPQVVSYSIGPHGTAMIPAPTTATSAASTHSVTEKTSAAASPTATPLTPFTGGAPAQDKVMAAGVAGVVFAGIALVL